MAAFANGSLLQHELDTSLNMSPPHQWYHLLLSHSGNNQVMLSGLVSRLRCIVIPHFQSKYYFPKNDLESLISHELKNMLWRFVVFTANDKPGEGSSLFLALRATHKQVLTKSNARTMSPALVSLFNHSAIISVEASERRATCAHAVNQLMQRDITPH